MQPKQPRPQKPKAYFHFLIINIKLLTRQGERSCRCAEGEAEPAKISKTMPNALSTHGLKEKE